MYYYLNEEEEKDNNYNKQDGDDNGDYGANIMSMMVTTSQVLLWLYGVE